MSWLGLRAGVRAMLGFDCKRAEDLAARTRRLDHASVRAQRQCWPIRRRSWSRDHRASCGTRMRGPSGPRARASASVVLVALKELS